MPITIRNVQIFNTNLYNHIAYPLDCFSVLSYQSSLFFFVYSTSCLVSCSRKACGLWASITSYIVGYLSHWRINVVCLQHDTTRTFFMTVEAPESIRRGEQIGLRLDLFNNWDQDLEVCNA